MNASQALPKSGEAQGGWRYTPTSRDSDLSVSGWQLMALRGAANAGANIPPGALQAGIDYVKHRATVNGAFAYTGSGATTPALTATGVLTLCLLGQPNAPEVSAGGDFLLRNNADKNNSHYYYTVYYCCQAAWQLGIADRKYWVTIHGNIASSLADKQLPDGACVAHRRQRLQSRGREKPTPRRCRCRCDLCRIGICPFISGEAGAGSRTAHGRADKRGCLCNWISSYPRLSA